MHNFILSRYPIAILRGESQKKKPLHLTFRKEFARINICFVHNR